MDTRRLSTLPELGIEEIDREHREILEMIIALRNVVRSDANERMKCNAFEDVLEACITFIRSHFATEEALMQQSLYPSYESHRTEHELFLRQLYDLQSQVSTGTKIPTLEMLNLMGNWLHHHVLETDRPLVPYLMNKAMYADGRQIGASPGSCFERCVATSQKVT